MCTVSFLPLSKNDFILTSNRDESPIRKTIPPKKYIENNAELFYPKDELAGGTWIGLSNKNRLVCLLNGGFEKHNRNKTYRMSRGIVVKKVLSVDDPEHYINSFDFNNIEPFTLILVNWDVNLSLYELVWDGNQKHFQELPKEPRIWSSSTLYDATMKKDRENWFTDWLMKTKNYDQKKILDFHQSTDKGTEQTTMKMKRPFVETVSITSIKKEKNYLQFDYIDIRKGKTYQIQL